MIGIVEIESKFISLTINRRQNLKNIHAVYSTNLYFLKHGRYNSTILMLAIQRTIFFCRTISLTQGEQFQKEVPYLSNFT